MMTLDKDKMMWIEIRSGLIGLKKAIRFTTRLGAGGGIALSALGRIIRAIEKRWDLSVSDEQFEEDERISLVPK